MNEAPESIAAAEREFLQSRARMVAEYRALETTWRRRARTPSLVGGLLVTALVVGYLATGRRASVKAGSGNSTAWARLLQLGPVLVPVLQMLRAWQAGRAILPAAGEASAGEENRFGDGVRP